MANTLTVGPMAMKRSACATRAGRIIRAIFRPVALTSTNATSNMVHRVDVV